MSTEAPTELVAPTHIGKGDVIEDELGRRWLTVTEVQVLGDAPGPADDEASAGPKRRVFSFFGDGPEDRVTFEDTERVRRKCR